MCFNYHVSITSFIFGTIWTVFNYYVFKKNSVFLILNTVWFGTILMQLWESFIWKNYKCELMSKFAKITNLIQPFLLLLFIPYLLKKNTLKKTDIILVTSVCIIYILSVKHTLNKKYECVLKKDGVIYEWWDSNNSIVYVISTVILFALLVKNKRLANYQIGFFLMSLLTSIILYKPSHVASVWCLFASAAPVFNYILYKFII